MRNGGLLDRFPIHLVTGANRQDAALILDDSKLGRLQLQPVPEGNRKVIALSLDREELEETRNSFGICDGQGLHLIQADPEMLPFQDQSFGTVLTLSHKEPKLGLRAGRNRTSDASSEELARVLSPTGCVVELARMPNVKPIDDQRQTKHISESRAYYVRPASGTNYFVTPKWVPESWPFECIHQGRLQSMRLRANLLLSRLGDPILCDGVRLLTHWKSSSDPLFEIWNEADDRAGQEGKAKLNAKQDYGIFIKAGMNAFLLGGKGSGSIVKFPLSVGELPNMENHIRILDRLNASGNEKVKAVLPTILDRGYLGGQSYWAESLLGNKSTMNLRWQPGSKEKTAVAALSFIVELHCSTRRMTRISRGQFDELLNPHVAIVEAAAKKSDPEFDLGPLVVALWKVFDNRDVPLVRTHGDFWSGNLLSSDDGQLTGVLDWDFSEEQGWPMLDLLNFVALERKWRAIWHFGSLVTGLLMKRRLAKWEYDIFAEYCTELEIESELWPNFVALYWLIHVSRNLSYYDESWLERNVIKPLPQILEALSSINQPA